MEGREERGRDGGGRGGASPEGRETTAGRRTGPRGGTTTVTDSGMVKKNFWLPEEVAEELRTRAFEERRSEAEIFREALEWYFEVHGG